MKNILIIIVCSLILSGCNDINLSPLSQGSSENWYTDAKEIEMSVAFLFKHNFWNYKRIRVSSVESTYSFDYADGYCDDWTKRTALTCVTGGTINGQSAEVVLTWDYAYKCIAAANNILTNINKGKDKVTTDKLNMYAANAKFIRASQYAKLIFLFGDVPYYTGVLNIDEAFALSRTPKKEVLDSIYADYDYAIQYLPLSYGASDSKFATKGAALAMKARIALYMEDWRIARDAAKACMALGVYSLYPDYSKLFLASTKNSVETIFGTPLSVTLGESFYGAKTREPLPRTVNGYASGGPSFELLCAYLCRDGLPIDKSPLFNPRNPFKNRDPRCTATIVEFQTDWLGFKYQPHPDSIKVLNVKTGQYVSNQDTRSVNPWCSFNGLVWKKGIDEDWIDGETDPDNIIIRYADVLLIYAEAKIELGEIDGTVLEAMNRVRSRAYGMEFKDINSYPSITNTNQDELRKILRIERRMEFALEGMGRLADIIRWRLAEQVLNKPNYGLLDPIDLKKKIVAQGLWFFPETPEINKDGVADFTSMYNKGLLLLLSQRKFDASKQYLWPIPSVEIQINPNIKQNPGY